MHIHAKLEALLFYYGEPIEIKKIAELLHVEEAECQRAVDSYATLLEQNDERGLMLLRKGAYVQLGTKAELKEIGSAIIKEEFREQLTPAALDTLSLVAYLGPVTRATIDYIRGVNSSYSMRNLVMRGLVERLDEKGSSFHYRVTEQFLSHIGVADARMLPQYDHFHTALERFEAGIKEKEEAVQAPVEQTTPFDTVSEESAGDENETNA